MIPASDAELVRDAVARHDERAFAQLIARHERSVRAAAHAVVRDRHAAEDAAQEAFLIAYRRLPRLRVAAAFGGWVRQIARRQALAAANDIDPLPLGWTRRATSPPSATPGRASGSMPSGCSRQSCGCPSTSGGSSCSAISMGTTFMPSRVSPAGLSAPSPSNCPAVTLASTRDAGEAEERLIMKQDRTAPSPSVKTTASQPTWAAWGEM